MNIIAIDYMYIFILTLVGFLIISTVVLYFPGRLLLGVKSKNIDTTESLFLSLILGIAFIIFETIVTGVLKVRFISLPILLFVCLISVRYHFKDFIKSFKSIFVNKLLVCLLILGILVQGLINFPSGWHFSDGIKFWSSQGHDGLWHVSLMEEIKSTFPPSIPLYANHPLQNYHYASDIFMGEFYRLFPFFTSLDLYFRFYPIVFSFLIGLGVFTFTKRHWNEGSAYWSVFFTYFCGSFGYIVSVINHNFIFSGETTFWASQGNTILGNPPHALGIIFLTSILLLLSIWNKNKNSFWLILIFLIGFGLSTVKVSSGAVLVAAMMATGIYIAFLEKKYPILILGTVLAAANFAMLKVISPTAQSFLIFEPLWFPRTMMVVRLNWMDWELRRQTYLYINTFKSRAHEIVLELQAILIFIVGNSGARIISLLEIGNRLRRKLNPVDAFMISGSGFALVVVLLFVQKGITFNLIQFIQIYLHFLGIYAGATVYNILKKLNKPSLKILVASIIISFSVPTAVGNLFDFYGPGKNPLAIISNQEIEALNWLKNDTSSESVIFTKPFNKYAYTHYKNQPIPISAWYSTMYVHSISTRKTFLSGEEQLTITGYDIEGDLNNAKKFMEQKDIKSDNKFLADGKINYLYFRHDELETPINEKNPNLKKVFNNNEIVIYQYVQN